MSYRCCFFQSGKNSGTNSRELFLRSKLICLLFFFKFFIYFLFLNGFNIFRVITSNRSGLSFYQQSYIGSLDDIETVLRPLKKIGKIEMNFYLHFRTIIIIYNNEPARPYPVQPDLARPSLTVTIFDSLYLKNQIT